MLPATYSQAPLSSSQPGVEQGDHGTPQPELDRAVQIFLGERSRLLRLAQQVVGDHAAAEDVVQDAWLRWQRVDREEVTNPAAFLTTTTIHLAINVIQSARHRHESPTELLRAASVGSVPEPLGHAERVLAAERLLAVLMAKLTASELAVYVLRKGFDYPYEEIGGILGTSSPNARQLVRRAQVALEGGRARRVDRRAHRRLVAAFAAATSGELERLEDVLIAGVRHWPTSATTRHSHSVELVGDGAVESQVRTRTPGFTGAAWGRHAGSRERLDPLVTSSVTAR